MIKQVTARATSEVRNRTAKLLSLVKPYEAMPQGRALLDAQYEAADWDYLRSITEAPRFGVVAAYCHRLAGSSTLLEVGCGEGILLEHLDRSRFDHYTGVDISSVAIDRARALEDHRVTFVCASAEDYVPERTHQLIVFNEVVEYFDDPLDVVRRYEPFLAPDGRVVVSAFAGVDTARTRRIWKQLGRRYETEAHTRVSTQRDHLWNIKVLRPPSRPVPATGGLTDDVPPR
ncbi:class I SAM-dependent methyltransferase [Geodermatophilus sp. URMC 62]|uniref:class I SAM-dependent methyltransferase n=1 Tax=Geodermatophilus sp. URMC 62 TaxID=3423414 RepID=UPI00406CB792